MTPQYDLDLTQVAFEKHYGDITIFGTWFGKDRRPALVLMPTAYIGVPGVTPCVVPLSHAWRWTDIGEPQHCARVSVMFAESLGLSPHNIPTLMRITSIIRDHVGDLLMIPPKPTERVVVADAVRTDQDGREHHSEVFAHV